MIKKMSLIVVMLMFLASCASMDQQQQNEAQGTAMGATAGAAVGAIIGAIVGDPGLGAGIGAGVGAQSVVMSGLPKWKNKKDKWNKQLPVQTLK